MSETLIKQMGEIGIIPVVVMQDENQAEDLAKALCEGGLPCAEVTFRTAAAEASIRRMVTAYPDMLVGAGTVLTEEQVDRAVEAGAKFIVSPGLSEPVVTYCQQKGVPIFPGVVTPSEIEQALRLGLKLVKFFPAEPSGGLPMIKALSAPYHMVRFMPTGGINPDNVKRYLTHPQIFACGGSWMVAEELLKKGDFEAIKQRTAEAALLVKSVRAGAVK